MTREPGAPPKCYTVGIEVTRFLEHMMRQVLTLAGLAIIVLASALFSTGQGAPAQIDAALLDLSARLGHAVGIGDLTKWRWEQTNFPDSALGCPASAGSGGQVLGYQFQLTYNGVTHDYRVSADSALLVYCGVMDPEAATAASVEVYSNRLCAEDATGGPYMRSRIIYGIEAEVIQGYLNLRGGPSADAQVLMEVPAGLPFAVAAGPDCVDGYVWWLVNVNGQLGYIAEAGDGAYYIAAKQPAALPSREALNVNLVRFLQEFTYVEGNFSPVHAWSGDGNVLALPGAAGSDGLWIYDLRAPVLSPSILEFDAGITEIAFRPKHSQLLFGTAAGSLHLWQLEPGEALSAEELLYLNAHGGAVSALAFSADGAQFASAGPLAFTHQDVSREFAAIVWNLETVSQQAILTGHRGLIRSLAFRPDGSIVASGAEDNDVKFWDVSSASSYPSFPYGSPPVAMAYSADGSLFAIGVAGAGINLQILNAQSLLLEATYSQATGGTTSLAFSPDGTMLVVGAAEGAFSIWDTSSHARIATYETESGVRDVSFSPDGTMIAVSTAGHRLSFYGVLQGSG